MGPQPGSIERQPQELGIHFPDPPGPFGICVETVQSGNLLFLSGMLSTVEHRVE